MSTLDSSGPPPASNGNLPAIQYLPHPPNDMVSYHPQQSPMAPIPPPQSQHQLQQPGAYLPQPQYLPPAAPHYTAHPTGYDAYPPPPPHQSPYGMPQLSHSPYAP